MYTTTYNNKLSKESNLSWSVKTKGVISEAMNKSKRLKRNLLRKPKPNITKELRSTVEPAEQHLFLKRYPRKKIAPTLTIGEKL